MPGLCRYHVFFGHAYYPDGGMQDYCGSFVTLQEAKDFLAMALASADWAHVAETGEDGSLTVAAWAKWDMERGKVVWGSGWP